MTVVLVDHIQVLAGLLGMPEAITQYHYITRCPPFLPLSLELDVIFLTFVLVF